MPSLCIVGCRVLSFITVFDVTIPHMKLNQSLVMLHLHVCPNLLPTASKNL